MKGVIFTEFVEMVETRHSLRIADRMLDVAASGGAYTAVGDYDHRELHALVRSLAGQTGLTERSLRIEYGRYLFARLAKTYPNLVTPYSDCLSLLERVDDTVHAQVRKLYPDVHLPSFRTEKIGNDALRLTYQSDRGLADLAEGLIAGCIDYFEDDATLERSDPATDDNYACFEVKKSKR